MRCPTLPSAYGAMIQYRRRPWLCSDVWLASGNVMAATAPEVARALADVLEREALPYAIGGALALGFYALPRATADVDLNVFLPPAAIDQVLRALLQIAPVAGFTVWEARASGRPYSPRV